MGLMIYLFSGFSSNAIAGTEPQAPAESAFRASSAAQPDQDDLPELSKGLLLIDLPIGSAAAEYSKSTDSENSAGNGNSVKLFAGVSGQRAIELEGDIFTAPGAILATEDTILVLDTPNFRVLAFKKDGTSIGPRALLPRPMDTKRRAFPMDMAIEKNGNLWILDSGTRFLTCFDTFGAVTINMSLKGLADLPIGISIAADGTFLVEDGGSGRVLRIDRSGKLLGKLPAICRPVTTPDGLHILATASQPMADRMPILALGLKGIPVRRFASVSSWRKGDNILNVLPVGSFAGRTILMVVFGRAEDCSSGALAIEVTDGIQTGSVRIPASPGFATGRFICAGPDRTVLMHFVEEGRYRVRSFSIR